MSETSKKILSFYDQHIDEFGGGPRAVGWSDKKSQEARFVAICKMGDLDNSTVLDVGCGLGDLYAYINDHYQGVAYTGININPRYIEQAKVLYPDAHFEAINFEEYESGPCDYVCASGMFAVKIPDYKKVYFGQIKKMFAMARKGVACTMLDAARHPNDETYAAYSIDEARAFCLSLTDDVAVYQDYLPHDFTVILRK